MNTTAGNHGAHLGDGADEEHWGISMMTEAQYLDLAGKVDQIHSAVYRAVRTYSILPILEVLAESPGLQDPSLVIFLDVSFALREAAKLQRAEELS